MWSRIGCTSLAQTCGPCSHPLGSAVRSPRQSLRSCMGHTSPSLQVRATGAPCVQAKMYVPSDSFGGKSPERKAAEALQRTFTFIAARIVLAQLEGSGRGALGSYNAESFRDLTDFLHSHSMEDANKWLGLLLQRNEMLALRIMEVRTAYCADDFEWETVRKLTLQGLKDANISLLRKKAEDAYAQASSDTAS